MGGQLQENFSRVKSLLEHAIIILSHQKITKVDHKGVGWGVKPYGQPDRKKTVSFDDNPPNLTSKIDNKFNLI